MAASLKVFTSQQAARRVGVSYPMLMRWVRLGLIKPPGYAGRQWAAVEWTQREVERARLVFSLKSLGLSPGEILGLLGEYEELFEAGYRPLWIVQGVGSQGKRTGRALVLAPQIPSLGAIPKAKPRAKVQKGPGKAMGAALVIGHAVHVPLEGKAPGKPKRRGKK